MSSGIDWQMAAGARPIPADASPESGPGSPACAASGPERSPWAVAADVVALTKPRVTALVVATTLGGLWIASRFHAVPIRAAHLAVTIVGTTLVVGGANALNMYLERDSDRLMARTRNRPLPARRLAPEVALSLGLLLSAISLPLLTFAVNPTTALLAAIALATYVLVYTPLKRRSPASLPIGAVPGAIPPLLGWTAVAGRIEWGGLILFGILFLWQIPHFLAIATFRRDDYARAGLKVLPVVRGDRVTRGQIVAYSAALVLVSTLLVPAGVAGATYLAAALLLGAGFLGAGAWGLRRTAGPRWARGLFLASMAYLVLLLAALAAGT